MILEAFVTLAAVDIEELINFYRLFLHQEPSPHIPGVYGEFHLDGLRLGIFRPNQNHQEEFRYSAGSGMSICLEVKDLEQAIAHLQAIGYPPPAEVINASHGREIYAFDPAFNRLILHESRPKPI